MSELLGTLLVREGLLTEDQLTQALERQASYGGRLASVCLNMGLADERSLAVVLSRATGVPFLVLSRSAIPVSLTRELPFTAATKLQALPLRRDGRTLQVALASPRDVQALDELRFGTGARLIEYGALTQPLHNTIQQLYALKDGKGAQLVEGQDLDRTRLVDEAGYLELVRGTDTLDNSSANRAQTPLADLMSGWDDGEIISQPTAKGQPTLLVVDDEPDLRGMLVEYLKRYGYRVLEAGDGHTALRILQEQLPHLIVLDAMLPGVHGFEICHQVKHAEATRHIAVVMISALYRGWRYADDVKRLYGADEFLEKPFRLEELRRVIEQHLQAEEGTGTTPEEISTQANQLLAQAANAYRAGDAQTAVRHLEDAVAQAPFSAELQQRLALLYEQLGQAHRAIAARERLVELRPEHDQLLALAQLYERHGFTHKAFEAWERCFWTASGPEEAEKIRGHMNALLPRSG
ncbi:MAG: response regulator [Pseudomonadota bacterium]